MRAELEEKIARIVEKDHYAVLSTCGPLGVLAGRFPCQFQHNRLFFLVPATIDLLENLTDRSLVVATASEWQLCGKAGIYEVMEKTIDWEGLEHNSAQWYRLIEIIPKTVQIIPRDGWGFAETIDFE